MLSNHLKNTYNNYRKTIINSSIKTNPDKNFENKQDNNQNSKKHTFYSHNQLLSSHDKATELDRIVHSPSLMNTLILKSIFTYATHN